MAQHTIPTPTAEEQVAQPLRLTLDVPSELARWLEAEARASGLDLAQVTLLLLAHERVRALDREMSWDGARQAHDLAGLRSIGAKR